MEKALIIEKTTYDSLYVTLSDLQQDMLKYLTRGVQPKPFLGQTILAIPLQQDGYDLLEDFNPKEDGRNVSNAIAAAAAAALEEDEDAVWGDVEPKKLKNFNWESEWRHIKKTLKDLPEGTVIEMK